MRGGIIRSFPPAAGVRGARGPGDQRAGGAGAYATGAGYLPVPSPSFLYHGGGVSHFLFLLF
jgi:hypothetical protein